MADPTAKLDGLTFQEALEMLKLELAEGKDKTLIAAQLEDLQNRLHSITDTESQEDLRRQCHELRRQTSN